MVGDREGAGERFALEAAGRLAPHAHVVELANEPTEIGMRQSLDESLVALGRAVKAGRRYLLGGGAVDGEADRTPRMARAPFDYVDAHLPRAMGVGGFAWVQQSGRHAAIDQDRCARRMQFISPASP
ncbi:MAG: hypothetical protein R2708_24655 [Vicinamibacterales bacterium]